MSPVPPASVKSLTTPEKEEKRNFNSPENNKKNLDGQKTKIYSEFKLLN